MWRWSARASRAPGLSADADGTADQALTRLYAEHSRSLLRLAALLVNDAAEAEEITQAAFAATHDAWQRLGDTSAAAAFLRRAVVRGARSVRRHGAGADGGLPARPDAVASLAHADLAAMLRSLPERQREALVLCCYGELSEAQAGAAMGVGPAAVRRHSARAVAALRTSLEQESGLGTSHHGADVPGGQ